MSTQQKQVMTFPSTVQSSFPHALSGKAREDFLVGVEHLEAGEPVAAIAALSQSLQLAPNFAPTHIFFGIAQALTSNIYPAIDHLEKAGQLEPDSFAAHYTLAQLNFKLRIPKKGYEAAERARKCIQVLEQRKMLTELLKEERVRERNGISRPLFDQPFRKSSLVLAGVGLLAAIVAIVVRMS